MITLNGKIVQCYEFFRYLGSIIQKDGKLDGDVVYKIKRGWLKWKSATRFLCNLGMRRENSNTRQLDRHCGGDAYVRLDVWSHKKGSIEE